VVLLSLPCVPCASLTCLAETYCRARSLAQLLYYRPKPKEYYYYLLYYARVNECELLHTGFLSHTLRSSLEYLYTVPIQKRHSLMLLSFSVECVSCDSEALRAYA